jgi:hypothetical protein
MAIDLDLNKLARIPDDNDGVVVMSIPGMGSGLFAGDQYGTLSVCMSLRLALGVFSLSHTRARVCT